MPDIASHRIWQGPSCPLVSSLGQGCCGKLARYPNLTRGFLISKRRKFVLALVCCLVTVIACSTIVGIATNTDEPTALSTTSSATTTPTAVSTTHTTTATSSATPTGTLTPSPTAPSHPSPTASPQSASPVPTRSAAEELLATHTAQELLDCDRTTLDRQLQGRSYPGEKLSDCEIAYSIAKGNQLVFLESTKDATLLKHAANLEEMSVDINRLAPATNAVELRVLCNAVPAWAQLVQEASEYYESLNELDLLGWGVSILNAQRYTTGMIETCSDI